MNTHIIGFVVALTLAFLAAIGAWAADNDHVTQTRKVDNFTRIEVTAVANLYFTQGETVSLRIEGREKYVNLTTTEVKNGKLRIGMSDKGKKRKGNKNGVDIYLTAPTLERVNFTGVGSFVSKEAVRVGDIDFYISGVGSMELKDLHCDRLGLYVSGVGEADVNVQADHIDATLSGVGSVTLEGKTRTADISKGGIGSMNTRHLTIEED